MVKAAAAAVAVAVIVLVLVSAAVAGDNNHDALVADYVDLKSSEQLRALHWRMI